MEKVFFTPGPSQLYSTYLKHVRKSEKEFIGSISHRSDKFHKIYQGVDIGLRKLLKIPKNYHIFFTGSSLESMERIIENTVFQTSAHLVSGAFSQKFFEIASDLKKQAIKIEIDIENIDFDKIIIPEKAEIVCITENETSTGTAIPFSEILKLKKKYKNKLFAIDCVSSVPFTKIDFSCVDIVFFSVQKGFGLPAGLGILIVNDESIKKSLSLISKGLNVGSYHKFCEYLEKANKFETPETPNVLNIYLLEKIIADMLKKGIRTIRGEVIQKSKLIYEFLSDHPKYKPFIKNRKFQSNTTINIDVGVDSAILINKLERKGIIVGAGYGKYKQSHIRIANFPAHKISDVKKMLRIISK
jgi:phosphoserine aminotransferase